MAAHRTVSSQDLQRGVDELLNFVEQEGGVVVVTRHGKPAADLVPHRDEVTPFSIVSAEGLGRIAPTGIPYEEYIAMIDENIDQDPEPRS